MFHYCYIGTYCNTISHRLIYYNSSKIYYKNPTIVEDCHSSLGKVNIFKDEKSNILFRVNPYIPTT